MSAILKVLPAKRGRAPVDMPEVLRLFPSQHRGGRVYVYAIAFKGGVVKLGKSRAPRGRLRDHWRRGAGEVLWVHLFTSMSDATANLVERRGAEKLSEIGRRIHSSEWFHCSAGKAQVIAVIRECIDTCRAEVQARIDKEREHAAAIKAANAVLDQAGLTSVRAHVPSFWGLTPSRGNA